MINSLVWLVVQAEQKEKQTNAELAVRLQRDGQDNVNLKSS